MGDVDILQQQQSPLGLVDSPSDPLPASLSSSPSTTNTNTNPNAKKRGSSFSLSYFDQEDDGDELPSEESKSPPTPSKSPPPPSLSSDEPRVRSSTPPHPAVAQHETEQEQGKEDTPASPPTHEEEIQDPASSAHEEQDTQPQPTAEEKEKEKKEEEEGDSGPGEDFRCFFTHDSFPVLKEKALEGRLQKSNMRGITWRVLLGVLSPDTSLWAAQMQKHREKFIKIKEKHIIDPHKASMHNSEADKFNPLSQDEENPWNQYFQNAELQKEITHDVIRTYQGNPFFDKQETKDTMTQLLFLYAKEHSTTRYIQGMNELLAPILWVLTCEKSKASESPSIFEIVSDEQYIIHDTYTLFSHLLEIVGRWFSPLKSGNSPVQSKKDSLLDDKLYFGSGQADESTNLQIVQQCRHIHFNLLTEVEPHLSRYLKDLQIEPHLYMLRWVRILLTQVFQLQDVLIIWDGIFAFGNNAVLLDWLCVAMLVNIRHLLLGQDYSRCMQLLFNYPQDQDINALVATSLKLYNKYQQQRQISPPKNGTSYSAPKPTTNTVTVKPAQPTPPSSSSSASSPPSSSSSSKPSSVPINAKPAQNAKPSPPVTRAASPPVNPQYPPMFQEPLPAPPPTTTSSSVPKQKSILQMIFSDGRENSASELSTVNEEAQTLRNTAAHMANRLERVLFLLGSLASSTPENEETLKLAVEEVMQVKQTLSEAAESKVRHLASNEDSQETNSNTPTTTNTNTTNSITHNNNNLTNNPLSTSTQQDTPTPFETNQTRTSPLTTQNVYEKILRADPLNLFRRK